MHRFFTIYTAMNFSRIPTPLATAGLQPGPPAPLQIPLVLVQSNLEAASKSFLCSEMMKVSSWYGWDMCFLGWTYIEWLLGWVVSLIVAQAPPLLFSSPSVFSGTTSWKVLDAVGGFPFKQEFCCSLIVVYQEQRIKVSSLEKAKSCYNCSESNMKSFEHTRKEVYKAQKTILRKGNPCWGPSEAGQTILCGSVEKQ